MAMPSSTIKGLKVDQGPLGLPPALLRQSGGAFGRVQTLWRSVWRRRWWSVVTAWSICMAGWAAIALWPTSFNASAVVYADLTELANGETGTGDTERTPVNLLKTILLSEDGLRDIDNAVVLDTERRRTLRDDIILRSTVPPVFVVAYEHRDPEVARNVLETLLQGFKQRLEATSSATDDEALNLSREIDENRRQLEVAEAGFSDFQRRNVDDLQGAGGEQAELSLLQEEVLNLEERVARSVVERDEIAEALAKAPKTAGQPAKDEPQPSSEDLEQERAALEAELVNLRERYAETHPYVIAIVETLDALKLRVEGVSLSNSATPADAPPVDRDALEQRHGELIAEVSTLHSRLREKRREIDRLQALTNTTGSVDAEPAEFEAKKAELETALAALERRRNELGDAEGGKAKQEAFRLIKSPELPTDPIGPSRLLTLTAVLLGGFGLGAAAAVSRNRYKGVFESAWQLKRRFDVGVLGTISEVMTPAERKRLGFSRLAFGLACLALVGAFGGLVIAELNNALTPLGDRLRSQFLG